MALEAMSRDQQNQWDSFSGGREFLYKMFMAVNPVFVEIFQSWPKWWTNRPTDTSTCRAATFIRILLLHFFVCVHNFALVKVEILKTVWPPWDTKPLLKPWFNMINVACIWLWALGFLKSIRVHWRRWIKLHSVDHSAQTQCMWASSTVSA